MGIGSTATVYGNQARAKKTVETLLIAETSDRSAAEESRIQRQNRRWHGCQVPVAHRERALPRKVAKLLMARAVRGPVTMNRLHTAAPAPRQASAAVA